ncbi:MAG: metallophosphoesterase [Bacteroidales bacterium]|nr:metallophosphoesterase [Bacteroidales bacterium]
MRKHTALSLTIILCLLASCSPKFAEFTFVQMTDPQIGFRDNSQGLVHTDTLFSKAVEAVNALNPECVIITGDLINDAYDKYQDSIYRANRSKINAEVYEIPGNHDIRPWNPENHSNYIALRNYDGFSIRINGCAFIGFDSNRIKDGWEKFEDSVASVQNQQATGSQILPFFKDMDLWQDAMDAEDNQFKWLERELRKARSCRYIFVFLHCPVIREDIAEKDDYFNFHKKRRIKYIELFKKYGVDVVFAGHTHMDYDTTVDGIRFVTAGPVGSPLGRGYSGYEVVTVTKDSVDCKYLPTPGVTRK